MTDGKGSGREMLVFLPAKAANSCDFQVFPITSGEAKKHSGVATERAV